jgi:hypothetical protein
MRDVQKRPNGAACHEAPSGLTLTTVLMPSGLPAH